MCEQVGLFLMPSLSLFSFYWFALYNFDLMVFVLFFNILFGHRKLLSLRSLLYSNEIERSGCG